MSQADYIRTFVHDRYIKPARADGLQTVKVRAGDVHAAMGLANAMPAVCSALRSSKFNTFADVATISESGPKNGANVFFEFATTTGNEVIGTTQRKQDEANVRAPRENAPPRRSENSPVSKKGNYSDAVVLVSCVRGKLSETAPARLLYRSEWFLKARTFVEGQGLTWFILSALHGVVSPDVEIAPYERTLNDASVDERRTWADKVQRQLTPLLAGKRRIVVLAGLRYREFLVPALVRRGYAVEVPMEGLRIGEQLAWLSRRS